MTSKTEQQVIMPLPRPDKQLRINRLKPFTFKKGESGNPKGRPKSILSKKERLQLLSEYAKMNPKRANPIEAIREQNKMEGVYQEAAPAFQDNRTINIIVSSEKAKELTENAYHRFKEIEAERKRQED